MTKFLHKLACVYRHIHGTALKHVVFKMSVVLIACSSLQNEYLYVPGVAAIDGSYRKEKKFYELSFSVYR